MGLDAVAATRGGYGTGFNRGQRHSQPAPAGATQRTGDTYQQLVHALHDYNPKGWTRRHLARHDIKALAFAAESYGLTGRQIVDIVRRWDHHNYPRAYHITEFGALPRAVALQLQFHKSSAQAIALFDHCLRQTWRTGVDIDGAIDAMRVRLTSERRRQP